MPDMPRRSDRVRAACPSDQTGAYSTIGNDSLTPPPVVEKRLLDLDRPGQMAQQMNAGHCPDQGIVQIT